MAMVLFFLPSRIFAQKDASGFEFNHIKEQQGLSYNIINCFLKDRDGFLWIGTYDGLNRFDGSHFTVFKSNSNKSGYLLHNTVHDLAEDKEGNIWCATDQGLSRYIKKTGQFENIELRMKNFTIGSENVVCDKNGDIWFNSHQGLARYIIKEKKIEYFKHDKADPTTITSNYIHKNGVVEDPSRNGLWLATSDGINYFDLNTRKAFHYKNNPQQIPIFDSSNIYPITISPAKKIIYGDNSQERIVVYDIATKAVKKIVLPTKHNRKYFPTSTIFADKDDNIWVSTWNYTMQFIDGKTGRPTEILHDKSNGNSIASEFFWSAWQGSDGAIWFGTVNGISVYNPQQSFYKVHRIDQLFSGFGDSRGIAGMMEDNDGSWWIGTYYKGLIHYFPQSDSLTVFPIPPNILQPVNGKDPNLNSSILRVRGKLWLGSLNGVLIFDPVSKSFSALPMPQTPEKTNLYIHAMIPQGDSVVWMATVYNGLFKYNLNDQKWTVYNKKTEPILAETNGGIYDIALARDGKLWFSISPSGLGYHDPSSKKMVAVPYNVPDTSKRNLYLGTLAFDQKDKLWITSKGTGLAMYDPGASKLSIWRESEGLVFDHCMTAMPDWLGQVWIAAYNKFSIYNIAKNSFRNFTLPFNEANYDYVNFMFSLKNGHILASMQGIFVEFMPEKIAHTTTIDKPLINNITYGDTCVLLNNTDQKIYLGVDDNYFSISYGLLTQGEPGQFRYQYILEGLDDKWIEASGNTHASYTNVPGGDYVFKVKVISGNSEEKISEIALHVATVFYKTWWFRLGIVLLLGAIIYGVYRYRLTQARKVHSLQLKATRLEKDKTEIQYQNLMNQFNPHFLFNSLTSLNSLIYEDKELASQFLEQLSKVYRYLLTNKETQLVTLEKEIDFVNSYISLLKARFEEGLHVDIEVPRHLLSKRIVPVTFQIMVENAIKHNIVDDESPLTVKFTADEQYLYITNNIQRKAFVETSNKRGLASLQTLYKFLSPLPLIIEEKENTFYIKVPLL